MREINPDISEVKTLDKNNLLCTVIGLESFDNDKDEEYIIKAYNSKNPIEILNPKEIYKVEIYKEDWALYCNNKVVFIQSLTGPILYEILNTWDELNPSEGLALNITE